MTTIIICCENYKLWRSSLCSLHSPVVNFYLGPNISFDPCSQAPSIFVFPIGQETKFHTLLYTILVLPCQAWKTWTLTQSENEQEVYSIAYVCSNKIPWNLDIKWKFRNIFSHPDGKRQVKEQTANNSAGTGSKTTKFVKMKKNLTEISTFAELFILHRIRRHFVKVFTRIHFANKRFKRYWELNRYRSIWASCKVRVISSHYESQLNSADKYKY